MLLFSVHKCYVVIGRRDIIRELGNRCYAGLLYYERCIDVQIARVPFNPLVVTWKMLKIEITKQRVHVSRYHQSNLHLKCTHNNTRLCALLTVEIE